MNIITQESSPTFKHAVVDPSSSSMNAQHRVGRKLLGSSMKPKRNHPLNLNRGTAKVDVDRMESNNNNNNFSSSPSPLCPSSIWISGNYDSLPEVPMFYPIERTSTVVDCDPREIARRITVCLQKLSITAKFNPSEASLFAEALDYTKFYIRLYKNNNNNNNNNGKGILVELQRLDGDSFNFIKYVQAILASARGDVIDEKKATRRRSSLNYIPASILACHTFPQLREESNAEYMMHIEELLNKDRSDCVQLGIESLLLLTDQERSHVSLSVAEAVLNGNGHSFIKDFIHKCIHCPSMTLSPIDIEFDYASRQCEIMHNTALAVLGNSLQTASDAECPVMCSLLQSEEWMGRSGIVNALFSELSHAEERSHDAYHAARCLNTLLDSSSEMKRTLIERGLPRVMEVSQTVGQRRHSLLAHECDAALALMMSDV